MTIKEDLNSKKANSTPHASACEKNAAVSIPTSFPTSSADKPYGSSIVDFSKFVGKWIFVDGTIQHGCSCCFPIKINEGEFIIKQINDTATTTNWTMTMKVFWCNTIVQSEQSTTEWTSSTEYKSTNSKTGQTDVGKLVNGNTLKVSNSYVQINTTYQGNKCFIEGEAHDGSYRFSFEYERSSFK